MRFTTLGDKVWIDFGGCSLECTRASEESPCGYPHAQQKDNLLGRTALCLVTILSQGWKTDGELRGPALRNLGLLDSGSTSVPVNRATTTVAGRSVMKAGEVGGCPLGTSGLRTSTKSPSGLGPSLLTGSYYFKADKGVSFLLLQDI